MSQNFRRISVFFHYSLFSEYKKNPKPKSPKSCPEFLSQTCENPTKFHSSIIKNHTLQVSSLKTLLSCTKTCLFLPKKNHFSQLCESKYQVKQTPEINFFRYWRFNYYLNELINLNSIICNLIPEFSNNSLILFISFSQF